MFFCLFCIRSNKHEMFDPKNMANKLHLLHTGKQLELLQNLPSLPRNMRAITKPMPLIGRLNLLWNHHHHVIYSHHLELRSHISLVLRDLKMKLTSVKCYMIVKLQQMTSHPPVKKLMCSHTLTKAVNC